MGIGDKIFDATVGFERIKTKIFFYISSVISIFLIFFSIIIFFKRDKKTKISKGKITYVNCQENSNCKYNIEINEENNFIFETTSFKNKFKINDIVEIIYDPNNKNDVVFLNEKPENKKLAIILFCLAIFIFLFYYIINYFTQKSTGFAAFQGVSDFVGMIRKI